MTETNKETTNQDGSSSGSSASGSEDITSSSEYKKLLSESIERRNTIKELKTQMSELTEFKEKSEAAKLTKEEKFQKTISNLETQLESMKTENTRRDKLNKIGAVLKSEGAIDGAVSDIFITEHGDADMSDADAFKESLGAFKTAHPSFFNDAGPIKTPDKTTTMPGTKETSDTSIPKDASAVFDAMQKMEPAKKAEFYSKLDDDVREAFLRSYG